MKFRRRAFLLTTLYGIVCLGFISIKFKSMTIFRQETKNDGLLNVIHAEAEQMEVFPADYIVAGTTRWVARYELTFERFKPIYRFKKYACMASQKELDECVSRINELTPKEKALVLTSIFLFEKTRRPRSVEVVKASKDVKEERLARYAHNPIAQKKLKKWLSCFPVYQPDASVSRRTWKRWERCVEKHVNSQEIAFPAVTTSEQKLKNEWIRNLEECGELMKSRLNPAYPWGEWQEIRHWRETTACDSFLFVAHDDRLTEIFLREVAAMEESSSTSAEQIEEMAMLREYWFMMRSFYRDPKDNEGFRYGNSSSRNQKLGTIAEAMRFNIEAIKYNVATFSR